MTSLLSSRSKVSLTALVYKIRSTNLAPVGARAYYMHHVLHDWPDDQSREILTQVKDAMKPAYSKLLINEHVILSTGASWRVTSLDVTLFTLAGAKERSEYDWRQLIEGVGLRICKIWSPVNGAESLIECELH